MTVRTNDVLKDHVRLKNIQKYVIKPTWFVSGESHYCSSAVEKSTGLSWQNSANQRARRENESERVGANRRGTSPRGETRGHGSDWQTTTRGWSQQATPPGQAQIVAATFSRIHVAPAVRAIERQALRKSRRKNSKLVGYYRIYAIIVFCLGRWAYLYAMCALLLRYLRYVPLPVKYSYHSIENCVHMLDNCSFLMIVATLLLLLVSSFIYNRSFCT